MLIKGINTNSPMNLVFGYPIKQNFVGESESEDYKLQAGTLNSLDFRDPTHYSHNNTPPSLSREGFGFPIEQNFVGESASEDYKFQARNLNSLDFRDPTHHSHNNNTPPSLKREQSWHEDSPGKRPRVESTIADMSLDIGTVLEGHLTRVHLASDYLTRDFGEIEINDARLENRGPESGSSEEGEWKNEGMLEGGKSEEMHLREGEDHRADCDASNLRDLRANLPLNRDEEGRARLGQGRKATGSKRRRRKRATYRRVDRWVPDKRQSMS